MESFRVYWRECGDGARIMDHRLSFFGIRGRAARAGQVPVGPSSRILMDHEGKAFSGSGRLLKAVRHKARKPRLCCNCCRGGRSGGNSFKRSSPSWEFVRAWGAWGGSLSGRRELFLALTSKRSMCEENHFKEEGGWPLRIRFLAALRYRWARRSSISSRVGAWKKKR